MDKPEMIKRRFLLYLLALSLVIISTAFNFVLNTHLHKSFFFMPLAAVVCTSVLAGYGPAFLTVVLSSIAMSALFVKFGATPSLSTAQYIFKICLYAVMGSALALLGGRLKKALSDAEIAKASAENSLIKAREAEALRERFILSLSHDLRTPLTAAKARVDLLSRLSLNKDDQKENLNRIAASLGRVDNMIENLLDAGAIQSGRAPSLSLENIDLETLLKTIIEEAKFTYGERFNFKCSIVGAWGLYDPRALTRVIENLIGNAVKYGDTSKSVNITLLKVSPYIVNISIQNFGEIISSDTLPRLFDPFYRSGLAIQNKEGWGIGLSVVKALVEAHKGKVFVKSSLDAGTIFSLELPVNPALSQKRISRTSASLAN